VAERIVRFASLVGRENVIAGSDCGFSTFAGFTVVDPQITWAKLKAMAEGARIASRELWKKISLPVAARKPARAARRNPQSRGPRESVNSSNREVFAMSLVPASKDLRNLILGTPSPMNVSGGMTKIGAGSKAMTATGLIGRGLARPSQRYSRQRGRAMKYLAAIVMALVVAAFPHSVDAGSVKPGDFITPDNALWSLTWSARATTSW